MITKLTLELPEDVAHVRKARRVAACLLEGESIAPEDAEHVELVIGEICTNVVRHACSEEGRYRVTLELYADRLGVTVEDRGRGFDPSTTTPPGTERHDAVLGQRFGGLGLPLVRALTNRLIFRPTDPKGTTVYAEKEFGDRGTRTAPERERQVRQRSEQPEESG
jgi:serine/threonine-protein kinase RsbW